MTDENWEFDFSVYEQEEKTEQQDDDINKPPPNISGYKSRYSNFKFEHEQIAEIKAIILKYSIETQAGTQDINILKKHLAALYTYWTCFKDIGGYNTQQQIRAIITKCRLILKNQEGKTMEYEHVHAWILYLQEQLFRLRQLYNLGFDVEKTYRGEHAQSKAKIVDG